MDEEKDLNEDQAPGEEGQAGDAGGESQADAGDESQADAGAESSEASQEGSRE